MSRWDVGWGVFFVLVGGGLAARAVQFPASEAGGTGPGFFPVLVGGCMAVLGLALAVRGVRAGGRADAAESASRYWDRSWTGPRVRTLAAITAACVLYLLTWSMLPFWASTPVFLLAVFRLLGIGWIRSTLLALAVTGVLYGAFRWIFDIRL